MDFIAQLTETLGLEEQQAQALAGTLSSNMQNAVAETVPKEGAPIGNATHVSGFFGTPSGMVS